MSFNQEVLGVLKQDFERTQNWGCRILLVIVRLRYYLEAAGGTSLVARAFALPISGIYLVFCKLLFNCDISSKASIGPGLRIVHPYNIVIADGVQIGRRCKLLHEVTIGYGTRRGVTGVPVLGDDVEVNAGAKIVGPIRVGNGVRVGANAVLYKDVGDGSIIYNSVTIKEASE